MSHDQQLRTNWRGERNATYDEIARQVEMHGRFTLEFPTPHSAYSFARTAYSPLKGRHLHVSTSGRTMAVRP